MADLATLAQRFITEKVISDDMLFWGQRNRLNSSLEILSALLAFLGVGFLVFAVYLWLQEHTETETAAALMGLVILALALFLALCTFGIRHVKRRRLKKLYREIREIFQEAFEMLDEELSEPVEDSPKTSIFLASLAGFAAGEKFH